MLDNMNIDQIKRAVQMVRAGKNNIEIEVSGGVNLTNVESFVNCAVDYVSVGALTHSTKAIDIALKMKTLGKCES
jgi:nicotinate-nucleotide pyrophosphorylase (carboxylating)